MNKYIDTPISVETFKPLHQRILVLPDAPEEKTRSGIFIPETARERPQVGTVIAIGSKVTEAKVGDKVVYGKEVGIEIDLADVVKEGAAKKDATYKKYYMMHETQIFGTV